MKKIIALILALVMVAAMSVASAEYTLVNPGKLTVSTSPDFPPFEYTDDNDNIIGIEPDIMAIICERLGLEFSADRMDFDGALLAAQSGKVDLIMSGVTVTEDRKASYDFTTTYVSITQAIVSKDGAVTEADLKGKVIGAQRGTTGFIYASDDYGEANVIGYDTYALAFEALNNGQVDCIMLDDMVGQANCKMRPGLGIQPTSYEPESFAFGLHKGNPELLADINKVLEELIADGTVEKIILSYNE